MLLRKCTLCCSATTDHAAQKLLIVSKQGQEIFKTDAWDAWKKSLKHLAKTFPLASFTVSDTVADMPCVTVTSPQSMSQIIESKVKQAVAAASVSCFPYSLDGKAPLSSAANQRITDAAEVQAFVSRLQSDFGYHIELLLDQVTRTLKVTTLGSLQIACQHRIEQWLGRHVPSVTRPESLLKGTEVQLCLTVMTYTLPPELCSSKVAYQRLYNMSTHFASQT